MKTAMKSLLNRCGLYVSSAKSQRKKEQLLLEQETVLSEQERLVAKLRAERDGFAGVQLVAPGAASADSPEVAAFRAASTARALERITRRGLPVETVIDVGASNGMWSAVAEQILPPARYLLIEAQNCHREALETYCRARRGVEFVLAAAGDRTGEIFFDDSNPFGGVASNEATSWAKTRVPVVTIDNLVSERGMPGPFLLKLDTHGFEVPILNGAAQTLKAASLVVIEVYNFRILHQSLLFDEMCRFMRDLGFGVIDISEPLWRLRDNAFWQMDLFFMPLDREEFLSASYD